MPPVVGSVGDVLVGVAAATAPEAFGGGAVLIGLLCKNRIIM